MIPMEVNELADLRPTPASLLRQFLTYLGEINPHMALIDAAFSSVRSEAAGSPDPLKYIRVLASTQGHPGLYTDRIKLASVHQFIYISHITYISSVAEWFCEQVELHPVMNASLRNTAHGDYLRSAAYVLIHSRPGQTSKEQIEDSKLGSLVGDLEYRIIDFYRRLRNDAVHDRRPGSKARERREKLPLGDIEKVYGHAPNAPGSLSRHDVLLLSRAWQKAARSLSQAIFGIAKDEIMEALRRRYAHITPERRRKSVSNALTQEFLLTEKEAIETLTEVDW
jgi:hypothetical protein